MENKNDTVFLTFTLYCCSQSGSLISWSEDVKKYCAEMESKCQLKITALPRESAETHRCTVILQGSTTSVLQAKSDIQSAFPTKNVTKIRALSSQLFDLDTLKLRDALCERFEMIQSVSKTQIDIIPDDIHALDCPLVVEDGPSDVTISIEGDLDGCEMARRLCLVACDKMGGLVSDAIKVNPTLHFILAGRQHKNIHLIMNETQASIYIPFPIMQMTPTFESDVNVISAEMKDEAATIHITGSKHQVLKAKDMLNHLVQKKTNSVLSKTFNLLPKKLEYLMQNCRLQLREIMYRNGCYIIPSPNTPARNAMKVYGEMEMSISQSIKDVVDLMGKQFSMSFTLSAPMFGGELKPEQASAFSKRVGEIVSLYPQVCIQARKCTVDIGGVGEDFEKGAEALASLLFQEELRIPRVVECKVHVELSTEYREFLSGKKNGKINKIVRTANARVLFSEPSSHILVVEVVSGGGGGGGATGVNDGSSAFKRAMEGFFLLKDEFPAELKFYIEEVHHKRIIGSGGKNIQGVMKLYGVYVKFLGSNEFYGVDGAVGREFNVIARTPFKNASNLESLRRAVLTLVDGKDHVMEETEKMEEIALKSIAVPRNHHSPLFHHAQSECRKKIHEDSNGSTLVTLPQRESGNEAVAVDGISMSDISKAIHAIQGFLPKSFCYLVPSSSESIQKLGDKTVLSGMEKLAATIFAATSIQLHLKHDNLTSSIAFSMTTNNTHADAIQHASKLLEEYLELHQIATFNSLTKSRHEDGRSLSSCVKIQSKEMNNTIDDDALKKNTNGHLALLVSTSTLSYPPSSPALAGSNIQKDSSIQSPVGYRPVTPIVSKSPNNSLPEMLHAIDQITTSRGQLNLPEFQTHGNQENRPRTASQSRSLSSSNNKESNSTESTPDNIGSNRSSNFSAALRISTAPLQYTSHQQEMDENVLKVLLATSSDNKLDLLLDALEMPKYKRTFIDSEVDYEMFLTLTEEDFKELGLPLGARRKLFGAIQKIITQRKNISLTTKHQNPDDFFDYHYSDQSFSQASAPLQQTARPARQNQHMLAIETHQLRSPFPGGQQYAQQYAQVPLSPWQMESWSRAALPATTRGTGKGEEAKNMGKTIFSPSDILSTPTTPFSTNFSLPSPSPFGTNKKLPLSVTAPIKELRSAPIMPPGLVALKDGQTPASYLNDA